MCGICGCGDGNVVEMTETATGERTVLRAAAHGLAHTHADGATHVHPHDHGEHDQGEQEHTHADGTTHAHARADSHVVSLETAVLAKNDHIAARNRGWFEGRGVLALNLVSSPGAGKTTLLERTIRELADRVDIAVIEGDQMTTRDAERVRAAGARAVQINTGSGCHLEADMVAEAARKLDLRPGSLLLIENVGNLVCPAMFDLGERMKVVVTSVTEGEDKPLKYPFMFGAAEVVVLNKIDLAPHVDFDRDAWLANIRLVNPGASVLELSARTGQGMSAWRETLLALLAAHETGPRVLVTSS